MSDSAPTTREHTPQPGMDEETAEEDAPLDAHRLRPGRESRRTRFEGGPSVPTPSPSPSRDGGDGATLQDQFLHALLDYNVEKFEELLRNTRVNKTFRYGYPHHSTCLEIASRKPNMSKFVRLLLEHVKPNINRTIPEPIHYAAQKGNDDTLQVLLADKRTKVYALNSKGQTALHVACTNVSADLVEQHSRCFEMLVPKMSIADLNKPDSNGFTAFHALVRGGRKNGRKSTGSLKTPQRAANEDESSEVGEGSFGSVGRADDAKQLDLEARERLAELLLRLARGTLDVDSVRAKGRTAREDVELRFPRLRSKLPPRRDQSSADPHVALVNALHEERFERFVALLEQTDDDGNPALDPNHAFGYPLHTTCLELACEMADGAEFVRALLQAGADPNVPNKLNEKYPIHIACEKGHHRELDALLKYSKVLVDVNCEDKFGNSPLHCTVDRISDDKRRETGRRKCLKRLLENKQLDVRRTNSAGCTALLLAVEDGNRNVIKTFLGSSHFGNLDLANLNFNVNGRPLRVVIASQFPVLRDLLLGPSTPETLRRVERTKDLFELLNVVKEDDFVRQLNDAQPIDLSRMNDNKFTLLQRAAHYGMVKAVRALLKAGVDPNGTFPGNPSPPGVIATNRHHENVLQLLLEQPNFNVNKEDAKGNTALHYAARDKNLETVILLLQHGADMNLQNKLGKSPFGREHVVSLLDQCVKTNGKNALEEDYELILDYRLLAPVLNRERNVRYQYVQVAPNDQRDENGAVVQLENNCQKLVGEMGFLNMMSNDNELSALLDHPVALSFLELKWNRVRYLTYFNLLVYIIFMMFLNIFIILVTRKISSIGNNSNSGNGSRRNINDIIIFGAFALFFWMFLFLRELLQFLLDSKNFLKSSENYLDWVVLISSLASLFLPFATDISFVDSTPETLRTVNVITIMLSCFELLLLLGRISRFAKYIEMLKVVIRNYLLPLVSYSVILVAFGLSFHILCYENTVKEQEKLKNISKTTNCTQDEPPDFGSWHMSIVNSIVMMIGELEFKSLPDRSPQSIILFVFFVLLVTVVLLNLLTGLAVSDTAKIEDLAQQLRLKSRVGVILRNERVLVNMHNSECAAMRCLPVPSWLGKRLRRAMLFPGTDLDGRKGRVKPNQSGELALEAGAGERRWDRVSLDKATQIISRRGEANVREPTLAELDERVQEVLKTLKTLEARCGPFPRAEGREALMSVFSEGPEEWDSPDTPVVASREGSDH